MALPQPAECTLAAAWPLFAQATAELLRLRLSVLTDEKPMDKIIADFKQRKLQVDFIELMLIQNSADNPVSYKGAGYIRQTDDDVLTFKLYSARAENTDVAADFNKLGRVKSGTLYDNADFYTLIGTAIDGSTWTAEEILPVCDWLLSNPNPVVKGTIRRCARGKPSGEIRSLRMHYFEQADIPCLINEVRFTAADNEFHIQKTDGGFTVSAKSDKALPEHCHMRVEEALRFILAQSVSCRVLIEPGQLQLFSSSRRPHRTLLPPLIARGGPAFHGHSWHLFERYLAYVIQGTTLPYWHPCSNHLHNACEASANSLDAWAIGLGVAVEGLASLLPEELDPETKKKLDGLQTFIVKTTSAEYKDFAPRIQGLVNGLTQIRAIVRMNGLAESGNTDPAFVKAWGKLRNRGVHPTKRGGNDIGSLDYQRLIDEVHQVVVLMYHIVFNLIGYKGPYTDYAVYGFPQREYLQDFKVLSPEAAPATKPKLPGTKTAKFSARVAPRKKHASRKRATSPRAKNAAKPRRSQPKKSRPAR